MPLPKCSFQKSHSDKCCKCPSQWRKTQKECISVLNFKKNVEKIKIKANIYTLANTTTASQTRLSSIADMWKGVGSFRDFPQLFVQTWIPKGGPSKCLWSDMYIVAWQRRNAPWHGPAKFFHGFATETNGRRGQKLRSGGDFTPGWQQKGTSSWCPQPEWGGQVTAHPSTSKWPQAGRKESSSWCP